MGNPTDAQFKEVEELSVVEKPAPLRLPKLESRSVSDYFAKVGIHSPYLWLCSLPVNLSLVLLNFKLATLEKILATFSDVQLALIVSVLFLSHLLLAYNSLKSKFLFRKQVVFGVFIRLAAILLISYIINLGALIIESPNKYEVGPINLDRESVHLTLSVLMLAMAGGGISDFVSNYLSKDKTDLSSFHQGSKNLVGFLSDYPVSDLEKASVSDFKLIAGEKLFSCLDLMKEALLKNELLVNTSWERDCIAWMSTKCVQPLYSFLAPYRTGTQKKLWQEFCAFVSRDETYSEKVAESLSCLEFLRRHRLW